MAIEVDKIVAPIEVDVRKLVSGFKEANRLSDNARKKIVSNNNSLSNSFKGVSSEIFNLKNAISGLVAGTTLNFIKNTTLQFESFERTLKFATGSAKAGAEALRFVTDESKRLGLDITVSAKAFASLSAAARTTSLTTDQTREIFLSVAEASRVMGLSSDDIQGAFVALTQIMSKGTLSAEELRGQLGERIPGAFGLAAKAMGVSTAELGKMLEQGKIISEDFLPKFAAEMRKAFAGDVKDATQSAAVDFANLSTAIKEFADSPTVVEFMARIARGLTRMIDLTRKAIGGFQEFESAELFQQNVKLSMELAESTKRIKDLRKEDSFISLILADAEVKRNLELRSQLQLVNKIRDSRSETGPTTKGPKSLFDDSPTTSDSTDKIKDVIDALKLQRDTLGMTNDQIAIHKLGLLKAEPAQVKLAASIIRTTENLRKQQEIAFSARAKGFSGTQKEYEKFLSKEIENLRVNIATKEEIENDSYLRSAQTIGAAFNEGIIPTVQEAHAMLEQLESEHQQRLLGIHLSTAGQRVTTEQRAQDAMTSARDGATNAAIGFLNVFAGKSKAAAIASIALGKALSIAMAIQNTAVAYTKALAIDPTGVLATRVALLGKVQIGLIAATGLAQAAGAGGGGSASGVGGAGGGFTPQPAQAPQIQQSGGRRGDVIINLPDDDTPMSPSFVRRWAEALNDQIRDGLVIESIAVGT